MMIAARNSFLMGGAKLPYDAEVEYIESTGTQWLDTGIIPQDNSVIEMTCNPYTYGGESTAAFFGVNRVGTNSAINSNSVKLYVTGYNSNARYRYQVFAVFTGGTVARDSASNISPRPTYTEISHVLLKSNLLVLNDTEYTFTTTTVTPLNIGQSMFIFASKNGRGNASSDHANGLQLKSFKITNGAVPVFDAKPVRVGQTGYLYDIVTGALYGNAGTGAFVLGPDK